MHACPQHLISRPVNFLYCLPPAGSQVLWFPRSLLANRADLCFIAHGVRGVQPSLPESRARALTPTYSFQPPGDCGKRPEMVASAPLPWRVEESGPGAPREEGNELGRRQAALAPTERSRKSSATAGGYDATKSPAAHQSLLRLPDDASTHAPPLSAKDFRGPISAAELSLSRRLA